MDECMLNDLLECSVCLERLDPLSKVLPCQHTFCKKCLDEIVLTHRELRCPECRVLVDAKVEELPPNVLLMRILEGMKNATPNKGATKPNIAATPHRFPSNVVRQVATSTSTSLASSNTMTTTTTTSSPVTIASSQVTAKQVQLHKLPYGRAIYDYISKVPGDLSFRKNDIIILRKKIDNNWYFGECGVNHGVFPLSYVQVIMPLTPHFPQCKALYDFRMLNDEEDGCLTFNKGEIISVIRRVDENWAEGKLLDRIGIFPLAFVELNSVARALMKLSTNAQPGPSRVAPPTPTNEETIPLIPTDHSRTVQTASQSKQNVALLPTLPVSDSSSNVSSNDSSTTTSSPVMTSPSSSSSSTSPSSPSSPALSPPVVVNRNSTKRHSFTGINSTQAQTQNQHRHSAEILSLENANIALEEQNNETSIVMTQSTGSTEQNPRHKRTSSNDLVLSHTSQLSNPSSLSSAYIALYPYKPQKADELELRKGGIYMVSERCQDGWFKGTSNRTQKCGVFPGNYVVPAKFHRTVSRPSNNNDDLVHQGGTAASAGQTNNETRLSASYVKSKGGMSMAQALNVRSLPPPELPPRALSPSSIGASVWQTQRQNQAHNSPRALSEQNTSAINSIVRSHSAGVSSIFSSPGKLPVNTSISHAVSSSSRSPSNTVQASSSLTATTAATTPFKPLEKVKDKKEKGVSLMRRLTNIKKSKSPPPSTYSMDNPVFDDGNSGLPSLGNPVHVRSGEVASISNHHRKSNSLDANMGKQVKQQLSSRDRVHRFRCIVPYPPNSEFELELQVGDIIYVHKKREDGWYKGTQQRTGRTGLFPASFVESF